MSAPHWRTCIRSRTTRTRHETTSAIHRVFPITTSWPLESTTSLEAETQSGADSPMNAPFDRGVGQALSPAFPGFDQEQSDNNLQFASETFTASVRRSSMKSNIGFVRFRRERRSPDAFKRNWIRGVGHQGTRADPIHLGGALHDAARLSGNRLFLE